MRHRGIGLVVALFAVTACQEDVPEFVDATPDRYLEMRPSPDRMVNENGNYNGGWYSDFTGRINPEDGTITVNGETWVVTDVYALLEDAYVVL